MEKRKPDVIRAVEPEDEGDEFTELAINYAISVLEYGGATRIELAADIRELLHQRGASEEQIDSETKDALAYFDRVVEAENNI